MEADGGWKFVLSWTYDTGSRTADAGADAPRWVLCGPRGTDRRARCRAAAGDGPPQRDRTASPRHQVPGHPPWHQVRRQPDHAPARGVAAHATGARRTRIRRLRPQRIPARPHQAGARPGALLAPGLDAMERSVELHAVAAEDLRLLLPGGHQRRKRVPEDHPRHAPQTHPAARPAGDRARAGRPVHRRGPSRHVQRPPGPGERGGGAARPGAR